MRNSGIDHTAKSATKTLTVYRPLPLQRERTEGRHHIVILPLVITESTFINTSAHALV